MAEAAGRDHRDYLLELLGPGRRIDPRQFNDEWNYGEDPERYPINVGRMRAVVERATEEAGWGRELPPGRGLGLAMHHSFVSYTAVVFDVEVNDELAAELPEKTGLPLQARELAGTMDAPPAVVREELLGMERVWPNTLASIQYTVDEAGERVYEVGSYAFRPEGFLGSWQYHVRLTPADDGRKTRLWAHYERSAWRHPVQHYNAEGWDSAEGVRWVASVFASDERFEASERARELLGE